MSGAAAFLAQHPPFSELDEQELAELADGLEEVTFPEGQNVLVEDAAPAGSVYVIC